MNEGEVESMETSNVVPEGVRELLEQRSTYRTWLERLDDVGGEYRPAVAERVRHDYEKRLSGVARELEGHRQELVSTTERRRGRLEELSAAFETRSAELEEAELRFQVGEFDDGTWEARRTELTEGLEEIEAELQDARNAVDELEQILDELEEGTVTASQPSKVAPSSARPPLKAVDGGLAGRPAVDDETASEDGVEPESDEAEQESVEAEHEATGAGDVGDVDEVDETASAAEVEDAAESTEEADAEDHPAVAESVPVAAEAEADEYRDELEFLESLSLDDPDSFDAVSRMLEDEEDR